MNTCERAKTLFVSIDVHKDTHTAVGLSPFGEKVFEMKIGNEAVDFIALIGRAQGEAARAEIAKHIRDISLDREHSVKERTRLKNQVHTLLYRIFNTGYAEECKDPFSVKALRYWMKTHPKDTSPFLVRSMKRKVRRLMDIREEIQELEHELETLITGSGHTIQTASGCGIVIAAEIIGEVGDISRFHAPASLAKYAGCAPREHSSGKTVRWRKTRSGNRRLHRSFHRMALSQISRSGNEAARILFYSFAIFVFLIALKI